MNKLVQSVVIVFLELVMNVLEKQEINLLFGKQPAIVNFLSSQIFLYQGGVDNE